MTTEAKETNLAVTITTADDKARYDECAKKLLSFDVIIAWILKSCMDEFSQYSVKYIMENCLKEKPEISKRAVHQDHPNKEEKLDGNRQVEKLNSESIAIKEQTVYFDIRFKAYVPDKEEPIQIIINLEIQLNDTPGYPLVKRGFYYCARMISEQYGTIFTNEQYEKLCKVQSIWICPAPAKKRKNGIFKYRTIEQEIYGNSSTEKKDYDLMEVVIVNLGDVEEKSDLDIINLLNVLFATSISPEKKKDILQNDFNIAMSEEIEKEVQSMCNLSDGLVEMGRQEGRQLGRQEGRQLGRQEGRQEGLQQGEDNLAELIKKLFELGRGEETQRIAEDKEYRRLLMKELGIL
jgi:predicted transposase/invertase (TIGR01784 family)